MLLLNQQIKETAQAGNRALSPEKTDEIEQPLAERQEKNNAG